MATSTKFSRFEEAEEELFNLARKRALLNDAFNSGNYLTAIINLRGTESGFAQALSSTIRRFQATFQRRHTPTGRIAIKNPGSRPIINSKIRSGGLAGTLLTSCTNFPGKEFGRCSKGWYDTTNNPYRRWLKRIRTPGRGRYNMKSGWSRYSSIRDRPKTEAARPSRAANRRPH